MLLGLNVIDYIGTIAVLQDESCVLQKDVWLKKNLFDFLFLPPLMDLVLINLWSRLPREALFW